MTVSTKIFSIMTLSIVINGIMMFSIDFLNALKVCMILISKVASEQ
jgi:hypothetical protein